MPNNDEENEVTRKLFSRNLSEAQELLLALPWMSYEKIDGLKVKDLQLQHCK